MHSSFTHIRNTLILIGIAAVGLGSPSMASADMAGEAKAMNESLLAYKLVKAKESRLFIMIKRADTAGRVEYERQYEELKPKIYDTAQVMERRVKQFELHNGGSALCKALVPDLKYLVPACLSQAKTPTSTTPRDSHERR